MRLLSINVGLPRQIVWAGRRVSTGIFKRPVAGPVALSTLNLEGDRQADLSVHGGPAKAVYVYPSEHYAHWRAELPGADLAEWGAFGENFTTAGLLEEEVAIGERFRIGTAEVQVTQPRMPCYKLAIKFGDAAMVERFLESRRIGFYLSVLREGTVEAGDAFEPLGGDGHGVTVAEVFRLYALDRRDVAALERAAAVEALPESWRQHFRRQIEAAS
jgi:MOSC domain-containing protein YiiM